MKSNNNAYYAKKKKTAIIAAYVANGKNMSLTARQFKISKTTIYKWLKDDTMQDAATTIAETIAEVCVEVQDEHKHLLAKVYKAKTLALDRLLYLLPSERDVVKVSTALKTLSEISGVPAAEHPPIGYYQQINNSLISKGYGTERVLS